MHFNNKSYIINIIILCFLNLVYYYEMFCHLASLKLSTPDVFDMAILKEGDVSEFQTELFLSVGYSMEEAVSEEDSVAFMMGRTQFCRSKRV